jgi:hypothetical protein
MALPLSRNKTYAPNDLIRSQDLNELQDWIVDHQAYVHGQRPPRIVPVEFMARQSGWTISSAFPYLDLSATTAGLAYCPIPVELGERIISVAIVCCALGGVAGDINASLRRVNAVVGGGSPGNETTIVATVNSAAIGTIQKIVLTPPAPGELVVADRHYYARINGAATGSGKQIMRVEVTVDRP